jgi:Protein of unknown function (DUF1194)
MPNGSGDAAMRRRSLLAAGTGVAFAGAAPRVAAAGEPVDVNLVLAVDVSRSIDEDEARLQREGYRAAVTDPRIVAAIRGGMIGAIGTAYVEWAGIEHQQLVIPWTRIGSRAEAEAWAEALSQAPRVSLRRTSLSGGIEFSRRVLGEAPWEATRRVIDVSGDGVNNSGPPVEEARDRALAEGITINGLPILNDRPPFGAGPMLASYFRERVIGGQGAFVIPAEDFDAFGLAVRRKLLREIAGHSGRAAQG